MEDRGGPRSWDCLEECSVLHTENWNNQGSVKVVIAHLAGCFGDQRATVASRSMEPALLHARPRRMVRADRVVGAQRAHPQRRQEMTLDVPRFLYQSAEGSISVRAPGVEEDAETLRLSICIDALAYGTGRIAASHRERLHKEV